jgi:hypothetical protein
LATVAVATPAQTQAPTRAVAAETVKIVSSEVDSDALHALVQRVARRVKMRLVCAW